MTKAADVERMPEKQLWAAEHTTVVEHILFIFIAQLQFVRTIYPCFGVSVYRRSTYACNILFSDGIFFGGFPLFFWAISSRLLPKCDTPVHELLFEFVPNRVIPVNQSTAIASNRFRNLNINRLRSRFPWLICESFNFNKASTKQADMAEIRVVGEHQ